MQTSMAIPRFRPYGRTLLGLCGRSIGFSHPPPPGVCCQATADGGTVCSDGFIGPPG